MHRVSAALITTLALSLSVWGSATAAPLNLNEIIKDETPEQLYDRLAGDPFDAFGPDEWGHPFSSVDYYRALPACSEALKAHPQEQRFALGIALADIAGGKRDAAKPVLEELIAKGNTSAMLALAYISPEAEAAKLILANFYNQGVYGVGLDPREATRLISEAAKQGDPAARDLLAILEAAGTSGTTPQ
jgi:TPR repeat protein